MHIFCQRKLDNIANQLIWHELSFEIQIVSLLGFFFIQWYASLPFHSL